MMKNCAYDCKNERERVSDKEPGQTFLFSEQEKERIGKSTLQVPISEKCQLDQLLSFAIKLWIELNRSKLW